MTKKYFTRLLQASLMCCLAVLFTACEDLATEDNPIPSYISLSNSDVKLAIGDTYVRQAIVAGSATVAYSSSDETIATVDQEGKVTALAAGTAVITAEATGYSGGGKKIYVPEKKSYNVEVYDPVNSLSIPATLSVTVGNAVTITPTIDPAGYAIEWSSSDETIATVDATGKVTGVAAGAATITAKAGGKTATCAVTVTAGIAYVRYTWDGSALSAPINGVVTDYTTVPSATTDITLPAGTYVVEEDATITGNIRLSGDVELILCDGKTLTVNGYINGYYSYNNYSLKIYGQSGGTGKLVATCNNDVLSMLSKLEIYGGDIQATTSVYGSGGIYDSQLDVYGGKLTAKNTGTGGYGIRSSYDINLYGGELIAEGKGGYSAIQYSVLPFSLTVYPDAKLSASNPTGDNYSAYAINCNIKSGTDAVKFKFSADGSTYSSGVSFATATATSSDAALKKNYCKVGYE